MRTVIIYWFISTVSTGYCQAWFPEEAIWHYDSESWFPFPMQEVAVFTTGEEVIVQNKVCRRVYGECTCGSYGFENILCQEGDIVYRYDQGQDTFSVLYDFTLEPGDTLTHYLFEYRGQYVLDSVTTMLVNAQPIRVQHFSEVEDEWVIGMGLTTYEFMGNDQCLYPQFGTCDPGTGPIRCYEDEHLGLTQFNHIGLPCDYTDATKETPSGEMEVMPNPASDFIEVSFSNRNTKLVLVNLLTGQEVLSVMPSAAPYQIDLSAFTPASYVLYALEGQNLFYERIIVIR